MTLDAESFISRLSAFPHGLRATCAIVSDANARWSPADNAWSVAQIALHLLLEEREDFRVRVFSTLRDPSAPWPPIDPERAVAEKWGTHGVPLTTILDDFARERADSVAQLRAIAPTADWSRTHHHPKLGPLSAGQLLACWCAHDALHLRQLAKRLHQLAARDCDNDDLSYAGAL